MKYNVIYDSPGRLRLRLGNMAFDKLQQGGVEMRLLKICGVKSVKASYINGGILVHYTGNVKEAILKEVSSFSKKDIEYVPLSSAQEVDEKFRQDLLAILKKRLLVKLFMPSFLSVPMAVYRALPFFKSGAKSLFAGKLNVSVLDAISIFASIASGSPKTAASVMTLLNISSLLEEYTKQKAKNALSDSLALNIEKVWRVQDGVEECIPLAEVKKGDILRVRSGSMIPVDASVVSGNAGVNESSMTGESIPSLKSSGMTVYAGTVVEEGCIDIMTSGLPDESRIHNIIDLIENSEDLKSRVQTKAERFADSLVPYSLAVSALAYLFTGSVTKALSVLMVDYSCAIKLSTPISVISAMKEAAGYQIMVKGGRYLENYAMADTIIFDKTGTLTVSCPHLARVIAFEGMGEDEVLKTAACLEEHFPHSVAKAIVHEAEIRNLEHREEHADVKYIVAHGIASDLNGQRALIGSAHFIFDDEHIEISSEQRDIIQDLGEKYSMVYLAIGEKLCGILCIEDPIRENAAQVISELKAHGIKDVLMITGDGESTAANVAKQLGIEKMYAKVLPEDKLNIINGIKDGNHKVIMVGDGINDSPALAAADASVAMKDASDIAREVADITLLASDLELLVVLRNLSCGLFDRIHSNYRFITVFNSALLLLGLCGVLPPAAGAFLHNFSTMGICAASMKPLLQKENDNALID